MLSLKAWKIDDYLTSVSIDLDGVKMEHCLDYTSRKELIQDLISALEELDFGNDYRVTFGYGDD
jgi:hypothetical protein